MPASTRPLLIIAQPLGEVLYPQWSATEAAGGEALYAKSAFSASAWATCPACVGDLFRQEARS